MNRKSFLKNSIASVAVLLFVAGCSVVEITADFMEPPKVVTDIKGIDLMEIVVDVKMQNPEDAAIAKGIICEKIAAEFNENNFCRTTDLIWGNPAGAAKMHSVLQDKKSGHGYARLATEPLRPRARMEVTFNADIRTRYQIRPVQSKLTTDYFRTAYSPRTIYWGRGERKQSERIQVPYSQLVKTVQRVEVSNVKEYTTSATGTLNVKVTDKKGKMIYQKSKKVNVSETCNHIEAQRRALPSNASLISRMTDGVIADIVQDLSPCKKTKKIVINKDGDERGFLLLQALAFTEAVETFERIDEKKRTFADWENLGVSYEAMGHFEDARKCYATALKVKKESKGLFDCDEEIAEKGLDRIGGMVKKQSVLKKHK